MAKEVSLRLGGRTVIVKQTLLDQAIGYFSPTAAARRMQSRFALELMSSGGGYITRRKRRSLSEWQPSGGDADSDILPEDRKSTRLNSSHVKISYAVFCLKKKKTK